MAVVVIELLMIVLISRFLNSSMGVGVSWMVGSGIPNLIACASSSSISSELSSVSDVISKVPSSSLNLLRSGDDR